MASFFWSNTVLWDKLLIEGVFCMLFMSERVIGGF